MRTHLELIAEPGLIAESGSIAEFENSLAFASEN